MFLNKPSFFRVLSLTAGLMAAALSAVVPARADVKVDAVSGGVALYRQGEGEWAPLKNGTVLKAGMELRILDSASVAVAQDGKTKWVQYEGGVMLEAGNGSESKNAFPRLKRGTMILNIAEEAKSFKAKAGELPAEFQPGIYSIALNENGELEAGAGRGELCLEGGGEKKVRECVKTGWTINYNPEKKTFNKVQRINPVIYEMWGKKRWTVSSEKPDLRVIRPAEGTFFREPAILVSGTTAPGCKVLVNNTEMPVTSSGSFSGMISLYEGENKLVIESRSSSGEMTTILRSVILDSVPPLLTISQPSGNFDPSLTGRCDNRFCYIQVFGLTEPKVSLLVNGVDASRYIEDDGSFFIDDFPVRRNDKMLKIEVEDMLGQRNVEIIYISEPMDSDNDGTPDSSDACPFDNSCQ